MSALPPSAGGQHPRGAGHQPTAALNSADELPRSDEEAFAWIYETTHLQVRRYLMATAGANQHLVDDALSDTYMSVWANMRRVRGVSNFRVYVFRVARNAFVSHLRRERAIDVMPIDRLTRLANERMDQDSAEHTATQREFADHVLRNLPPATWEVLALRLAGHGTGEIAEALGISRSTVAARMNKARQRYRELTADKDSSAESLLAEERTEERERASRQRTASRLYREGRELRDRGDLEGAEARFWQADALGDRIALMEIAELRENEGDLAAAETIYHRAHSAGESTATMKLARLRERAGDLGGAEQLYRYAAESGDPSALTALARLRDQTGEHAAAESIARRAAEQGSTAALSELAWRREQAGALAAAERLYREAIAFGDRASRGALAHLRDLAGDGAEAEALARQAASEGDTSVLKLLAKAREFAGDLAAAEAFYWEAVAAEDDQASVYEIVKLRADHGDLEGAAAAAEKIAASSSAQSRTTTELLRRLTSG